MNPLVQAVLIFFWAAYISNRSGHKMAQNRSKIMRCCHFQGREKTEYKQDIFRSKQKDGHLSETTNMTRGAPQRSQNEAKNDTGSRLNKIATEKWRGHGCSLGSRFNTPPLPPRSRSSDDQIHIKTFLHFSHIHIPINKLDRQESHSRLKDDVKQM